MHARADEILEIMRAVETADARLQPYLKLHDSVSAAVDTWCWDRNAVIGKHWADAQGADFRTRVLPLATLACAARAAARRSQDGITWADVRAMIEFMVFFTVFCNP